MAEAVLRRRHRAHASSDRYNPAQSEPIEREGQLRQRERPRVRVSPATLWGRPQARSRTPPRAGGAERRLGRKRPGLSPKTKFTTPLFDESKAERMERRYRKVSSGVAQTPASRWRNVAAAAVVNVIARTVVPSDSSLLDQVRDAPDSTVVLPLPGPARMLSGPSLASTTSRWLGEKWRMSKRTAGQRRQFLGSAVGGQLRPAQQECSVKKVVQSVSRAVGGRKAGHQSNSSARASCRAKRASGSVVSRNTARAA